MPRGFAWLTHNFILIRPPLQNPLLKFLEDHSHRIQPIQLAVSPSQSHLGGSTQRNTPPKRQVTAWQGEVMVANSSVR